ncbi:pyridoxamine 5'-phosphate oxidase family protein [Phytoactinopolyspora limicola]|uniref:pyridoxamine 5'-phosphate oxidase family protein n=1 Tax=Phytoactinopolyspora limicola TaxID=2715536 RepID=UPI00140B23CF|nr:pyridoxamine 5'-phosphate oxidase family protein [Phytoactinopolyspora limicola]
MPVRQVDSFSKIRADFEHIVGDVVYATMTTVDPEGRPRARVLLPIWQVVDGQLVGWLATYRTPVKVAHLASNPHATLSYWSPAQNTAAVDTVASWISNQDVKDTVWKLYQQGSPPGVGYDPAAYWNGGPHDPMYQVLRLDPWRVQVLWGRDLAAGRPASQWGSPA